MRRLLTEADEIRLIEKAKKQEKEKKMDRLMDSKYNKYLDSAFVRIGLMAVGFTVWLGVSVAILNVAA